MKKVMRPRYYCEHCGKGGGSGGHMKRHEDACTKNPARKCRMCAVLFEQEQPSLETLMALLPNPETYIRIDGLDTSYPGLEDKLKCVFPVLRKAAGNCPACIMAALRQKGIPVPCSPLNFTEECKTAWSDFNYRQVETEYTYG